MAEFPSPEEVAAWQRRLASQANNRAWALSESSERTTEDDEEMLQAAHAAMFFWKIVGNTSNRAHAAQLLAHVYALLKLPDPALHDLAQASPCFDEPDRAPWEKALAAAVEANVAAAAGESDRHRRHHELAAQLVAALQDPEDRDILEATLRIAPRPGSSREA